MEAKLANCKLDKVSHTMQLCMNKENLFVCGMVAKGNKKYFYMVLANRQKVTLVPEVYFYYFHCEGERKNKPLVESGN
jgi:hypothetical protein